MESLGAGNDQTFLTNIKSEKLELQMEKIKALIEPLNQKVESIESQFQKVLASHETDFKSAYRVSFKFITNSK